MGRYPKGWVRMAKKKSFAEKVQTKVVNKFADKVASGIVKAATTKPKKASGNSTVSKSSKKSADADPADNFARYNTKKCPECQALCFDAPVECPYCHADLKSVKPLTPKEFDKLTK